MTQDARPARSLVSGAFVGLFARHRRGFGSGLAATLPAKVAVVFLGGRHQPKTTAGVAQDGGTQKPLVEPYLFLYPHLITPCFRWLSLLNDKRRDCFNKLWQVRDGKDE